MNILGKIILFVLAVASFFIVLNKDLRKELHSYLNSSDVEVIASANADLYNDGRIIRVLKVRKDGLLFIQLMNTENNGKPKLIESFALPDKSDGYFQYRDQATNLAIEDLNGDRKPEIIAPSFDSNMTAHLNIYTYNDITEKFEPADPKDFPLGQDQ